MCTPVEMYGTWGQIQRRQLETQRQRENKKECQLERDTSERNFKYKKNMPKDPCFALQTISYVVSVRPWPYRP